MGYTHYYRNKRAFDDVEWKALTADVKNLLANCGVPLANGHGDIGTKPVFTKNHIMFNGIEDDGHETACVTKAACNFDFCKTAHKPYDKVVVEFYKLIRKYDPNVQLSSDGGDEIFNIDLKKIKVNDQWTYLAGKHDVKVGDVVILPPTPYSVGETWEGVVTAIGSSYTGPCKTILGVKAEPAPSLTLEQKIAEYLGDEFAIHDEATNTAARQIMKIVQDHLSS